MSERTKAKRKTAKPRKTAPVRDLKEERARPRKPSPGRKEPPREPPAAPGEGEDALKAFLADVWYEPGARNPYLYRDGNGEYFPWCERDFARNLRLRGLSGRVPQEELVSPIDRTINQVQQARAVHRSMILAGYGQGVREMNGKRILVKGGPRLPVPRPGEFGDALRFVHQLFGGGAEEGESDPWCEHQVQTFGYWLARRFRAIEMEDPSLFSPVLFLIGGPGCGKTLLQEKVITVALGGRAFDAEQYISGEDKFTGALFEAEHLFASDPPSVSNDYKGRMAQQLRLKRMVTGERQSNRAMFNDGETLCPIRAISYSANLEKLDSLPPFDADFRDKAHLLMCQRAWRPDGEEFKPWLARIVSQVPALLWHFLETFKSDDALLPELREQSGAGRFGQAAFHHPVLLRKLNEHSKEDHLRQLVDMILFKRDDALPGQLHEPWQGSASELRAALTDRAGGRGLEREVDDLLRGAITRTGGFLATLAALYPARFQQLPRTGLKRSWIIYPPTGEEGE